MKTFDDIVKAIDCSGGTLLERGEDGGSFTLPNGLNVIFSSGFGWEHASVSKQKAIPTWNEMCQVKDIIWDFEEPCMQLHPKLTEYINNHRECLHIWRPVKDVLPTPPSWMVGI